ncbi:hypothetical protein AB7M37_006431 [Sinorhizobium fredii]
MAHPRSTNNAPPHPLRGHYKLTLSRESPVGGKDESKNGCRRRSGGDIPREGHNLDGWRTAAGSVSAANSTVRRWRLALSRRAERRHPSRKSIDAPHDSYVSLEANIGKRDFATHDHAILSSLRRKHGQGRENGPFQFHGDREHVVRRSLPHSALGAHRYPRSGDGASFPTGGGSCEALLDLARRTRSRGYRPRSSPPRQGIIAAQFALM